MRARTGSDWLGIVILGFHLSAYSIGLAVTPASSESVETPVQRPNILFCIADDASFPLMGAYGCSWVKTPAFDRVAQNGILFTRAYTPNAKCSPSRACIITGRNSWQLEEAANHIPDFPQKFKTYAEVLTEHGYHVGFTGKGWAPGDAGKDKNGKPRNLCGPGYHKVKTKPPASEINNCDYAANFEAFLAARSGDKPFCFWYGGHEPHRGYEFKVGLNKGGKKLSDVDRVFGFWPDNETVRTDMLDYAYEVEYFDSHLARMLKSLEKRGLLANTLVVVTADNGMPFPRIKGQEYEYSNHMPLAMMWADGIAHPGRVVDDLVSFIDFAPTFLELAGVTQAESGMQHVQGRSLVPILSSPLSGVVDPQRDYVLIGKERHDVGRPHDWGYPIRGIVKGDYLYIHNFETDRWPSGNPETGYTNCDASPTKTLILQDRRENGTSPFWDQAFGKRPGRELYNIKTDPDCLNNLVRSGDAESASTAEELRRFLFAELKAQNDPRMFGNGHIFDEYIYSQPKGRNFYERYMKGEIETAGWINETDVEKKPLDQ